MKRTLVALMLSLCLLFALFPAGAEGEAFLECREENAMQVENLPQEREKAWEDYRNAALEDAGMQEELEERVMRFGDVEMRFYVWTYGEAPEGGYPMYIAMHGGGSSDTPDLNDEQYGIMKSYYADSLDCGVYVAVRGVRDTYDTHSNPESYPLYDRLIQMMILTHNVNPNRVYLEGFSAGGDGVYAISPRMADRFAAVNMSAGHPNSISLMNLKNLPIQLQVGENDSAYDRNKVTAEVGMDLNELAEQEGGYIHRVLVHADRDHNFEDYDVEEVAVMADPTAWLQNGDRTTEMVDSYPPDWMYAYTRDPLPEEVIWELDVRAPERSVTSFYYLRAPYSSDHGIIRASYDREENKVFVNAEDVQEFSILLNEEMVDFSQPIHFVVNGMDAFITVEPDRSVLEETTRERGDRNFQFEAEVPYTLLLAQALQ